MHQGLNFDLGETTDILRETVANFAKREIAPRAAEIDRTNEFPRDLLPSWAAPAGHHRRRGTRRRRLGDLAHHVAMEEVSRGSARSVSLTARIPTCA